MQEVEFKEAVRFHDRKASSGRKRLPDHPHPWFSHHTLTRFGSFLIDSAVFSPTKGFLKLRDSGVLSKSLASSTLRSKPPRRAAGPSAEVGARRFSAGEVRRGRVLLLQARPGRKAVDRAGREPRCPLSAAKGRAAPVAAPEAEVRAPRVPSSASAARRPSFRPPVTSRPRFCRCPPHRPPPCCL